MWTCHYHRIFLTRRYWLSWLYLPWESQYASVQFCWASFPGVSPLLTKYMSFQLQYPTVLYNGLAWHVPPPQGRWHFHMKRQRAMYLLFRSTCLASSITFTLRRSTILWARAITEQFLWAENLLPLIQVGYFSAASCLWSLPSQKKHNLCFHCLSFTA